MGEKRVAVPDSAFSDLTISACFNIFVVDSLPSKSFANLKYALTSGAD